MPSWIGPWEIAIVLILALLIFGPRKLPELGQSLGKSIRGFKKGMSEGQEELKSAVTEVRDAVGKSDAEPLKAEAQEPAPEPEKADKAE
jgi:sec-independent protein translocase protein TatA